MTKALLGGTTGGPASAYQAVLLEMKTANEICEAIGRKPIFKNDFAEDSRPREFGYLLRPTLAVVLSPSAYNGRVGLALLCPITNQRKGYPFEVRLPPRLRVTSVVLVDQIKSLDWRVRHAALICALPDVTVAEVLAKLATLLSV